MVASRLTQHLERERLLPDGLGSYRPGRDTCVNTATLAQDVFEGFQEKKETIIAAIDLEDAYNRLGDRDWVRVWHYNGLVLHYVGRQWIVADDYANYDYLYAIYGVDHDVETEEEDDEWTEEEESDEEEEESCECRGACNCRK